MTFQGVSSFVSDWATFFTAIAALLTLLEMGRQRKHSYKPDIVSIDQLFHGYFQSTFFSVWKVRNDKGDKNEEVRSSEILVPLFNLGNGAAKNIEFEWEFEFADFISKLNAVNKQNDMGIEIENSDFLLNFNENGEMKAAINLKPSLKGRKDYLLPSSIDKNGVKVSLPHAYIWLISNYFYLRFKVLSDDLLFGIPDLKLRLRYSDIANNFYETELLFNIGLVYFSDNEPMPDFSAHLYCKLV